MFSSFSLFIPPLWFQPDKFPSGFLFIYHLPYSCSASLSFSSTSKIIGLLFFFFSLRVFFLLPFFIYFFFLSELSRLFTGLLFFNAKITKVLYHRHLRNDIKARRWKLTQSRIRKTEDSCINFIGYKSIYGVN